MAKVELFRVMVIYINIYLKYEDNPMKKYSGKVAYKGVAVGEINEFYSNDVSVTKQNVLDVDNEIKRFFAARIKAIGQLKKMYEQAVVDVGKFDAEIFEVHQLMLKDELYTNSVTDIIKSENVNAEYAVMRTSNILCNIFSKTDDEYMRERALDIVDVSERIIAILKDTQNQVDFVGKGIIICNDLSPGNLLQLDKNYIKGIIIRGGSVHSHTSILARAFSIPTLVSVEVDEYIAGKNAVINGYTGELIIEPTNVQLKNALTLIKEEKMQAKQLINYKDMPCQTKDGVKINLYANIGDISELKFVFNNAAQGVGLFRTEFLCMDKINLPSEQEQYEVYKSAANQAENKRLIIRTFDIGSDKKISEFDNNKEANPAMGFRALRLFLLNEEREILLKQQLSAILRAAYKNNISILLPMISSIWEVQRVKYLIEEIKDEFHKNKIKYGNAKVGIMIETPSAALMADELAKEVDFFSIGSNDLTQFTLAADRMNSDIENYYNAKHPAVLKLVELTAKAAKENNIDIEVCGDIASDKSMLPFFIKNRIFTLSVSPERLLKIKKAICEYSEK